jgi:hypothetical protein
VHLLRRLIKVADHRLAYADQVAQLRRQRQWLIDLAHILDPAPDARPSPLTSQTVAQQVDRYLTDLLAPTGPATAESDHQVAAHIAQTFRNRWWGLFTCYDVPELPRTNNELERYMRRIKTGHRRILGHNDVHDFLIRYGRYVACVDYRESPEALLTRLSQVSQDDFQRARQGMANALLREQKRHRFRHHQVDYLCDLEKQWTAAVEKSTQ